MKTSEVIKYNAQLQQLLTKDNEQYYGSLVAYVRVSAIFRDEQKLEQLLLEVLQDILDAQKEGIGAEEYFGKNPKQIADDIIRTLPINIMDTFKLVLIGLGVYLLIGVIPELLFPNKGLDIGRYLTGGFLAVLFAIAVLYLLGYTIYRNQSEWIKWMLRILVGSVFVVGVTLVSFIESPWKLQLMNGTGIVVILLVVAFLLFLFYKNKDKKIWVPFIPLILTAGVFGILLRINEVKNIFDTKHGKFILVLGLLIALALQYLLIILLARKNKVSQRKR